MQASTATTQEYILTVNGGSSSVRCALYQRMDKAQRADEAHDPLLLLRIKIDRIQEPRALLVVTRTDGSSSACAIKAGNHKTVAAQLSGWLATQDFYSGIGATGHRVVHGLSHSTPQRITSTLLHELQNSATLDPEHLPFEIELINAFQQQFAEVPHIACFDTAFHRSMPEVARTLPIPYHLRSSGIERYGFHGLSYACLLDELGRIDRSLATRGRIIMAHLGNGASLAAIHSGQCVDTTMSFTPASGIMMSTRSGDIDPGLLFHLSNAAGLNNIELQRMMNHESGMQGVSGVSGDVRDLLQRESTEPRAALALEMFCYGVRKQIGAYAAALHGLDALIFAGGIGENAPQIRKRICDGLQFLGIEVDVTGNAANDLVISTRDARVKVFVMHTDEELMIARSVSSILNASF